MADPTVLRGTLDALDTLLADLDRAAGSPSWASGLASPRLVVDEGRAAAEWSVRLPEREAAIGLVVVCDVSDGLVTAARLYVGPGREG